MQLQTRVSLGTRLREVRRAKGMTATRLAAMVRLTPSLISQIETGRANPSVSTLYLLAQALDVPTDTFFRASDEAVGPSPILRRDARARVELDGGVVWERLTPEPHQLVAFLETHYPPGASSSPTAQRHDGWDCCVLIEGRMVLHLGFEEYQVEAGDSFSFDAGIPHRLINVGEITARAIWSVLRSPDGDASSRAVERERDKWLWADRHQRKT